MSNYRYRSIPSCSITVPPAAHLSSLPPPPLLGQVMEDPARNPPENASLPSWLSVLSLEQWMALPLCVRTAGVLARFVLRNEGSEVAAGRGLSLRGTVVSLLTEDKTMRLLHLLLPDMNAEEIVMNNVRRVNLRGKVWTEFLNKANVAFFSLKKVGEDWTVCVRHGRPNKDTGANCGRRRRRPRQQIDPDDIMSKRGKSHPPSSAQTAPTPIPAPTTIAPYLPSCAPPTHGVPYAYTVLREPIRPIPSMDGVIRPVCRRPPVCVSEFPDPRPSSLPPLDSSSLHNLLGSSVQGRPTSWSMDLSSQSLPSSLSLPIMTRKKRHTTDA